MIREELEKRGFTLTKKTGKEFSSACPFCGGDDRFIIWPEKNRAACPRGCGWKGDDIQLVRDLDKVSFREAAAALGHADKIKGRASVETLPIQGKTPFIHPKLGKPDQVYPYQDETRKDLFSVCRFEGKGKDGQKTFAQCKADGLTWSMAGVRLSLYHLPEIKDEQDVALCEGEKDTDAVREKGFPATCNPMGAGKLPKQQVEHKILDPLTGKRVFILAHNDEPGRKHAQEAATLLYGKAKEIRIVNLPDLPDRGDAYDFIQKHDAKAKDRLTEEIFAAPVWTPPKADATQKTSKRDIAALVKTYLFDEFDGGVFKLSDLRLELGLNDAEYTLARQCVKRMADAGTLQKHGHQLGCYRVVDTKKTVIDWDATEARASKLPLPGRLHEVVTIRDGDLINFAGYKNQSKTATAIEVVRLGLPHFQVHFFITEYAARMKARLTDFGIDLHHPNLHCYPMEKTDYIPDKIESGPGVLNVIDHYPNVDNFYLVGKVQDEICAALHGAICVLTHQKLRADDADAVGGSFWLGAPTLAVTLFYDEGEEYRNRMLIRKGKEPGKGRTDATGLNLRFKLLGGCQFQYDPRGWL